jgi:FHS family Na+ dependent glucose MFS transporter 1
MDLSESRISKEAQLVDRKAAISKTIVYYASYIALGLVIAVLGPTLPGLAEQTRTRLSDISFLFTAHSFGYLIGALLGGRFYDRTPGHPVMALSLITMMAMMGLVPLMPILWILALVLLVMGISEGVLDVGGNTLLVWMHKSRVGPFMSGLHFCFGLGALISPIIVAQMVRITGDINWAYWFLALLIFPISILMLRLPSPEIQVPTGDAESRGENFIFVGLISFFFFLHVGGEISFGGWIFTYTITAELADTPVAAYLTSAFWGSLTLGRLISIPVASRVKPRYILIGDIAGCALGTGIILLWPNSAGILWVGTVLTGLSVASIFPMTLTFAERYLYISGKITSWFFVGASVGGMFLPWLIGQLFESVGHHVTMIVLVIDFAVALGVLVFTLNYAERKH